MACETRLTENGIPAERNLRMVSLIYTIKVYVHPNPFFTTSNHSKARLVVLHPVKLLLIFFVILQPLTRVTTLRRTRFMERRAPLEA